MLTCGENSTTMYNPRNFPLFEIKRMPNFPQLSPKSSWKTQLSQFWCHFQNRPWRRHITKSSKQEENERTRKKVHYITISWNNQARIGWDYIQSIFFCFAEWRWVDTIIVIMDIWTIIKWITKLRRWVRFTRINLIMRTNELNEWMNERTNERAWRLGTQTISNPFSRIYQENHNSNSSYCLQIAMKIIMDREMKYISVCIGGFSLKLSAMLVVSAAWNSVKLRGHCEFHSSVSTCWEWNLSFVYFYCWRWALYVMAYANTVNVE